MISRKSGLRTRFILRTITVLLLITLLSGITLSVMQRIEIIEFRPPRLILTLVLFGIIIFIGTIFCLLTLIC